MDRVIQEPVDATPLPKLSPLTSVKLGTAGLQERCRELEMVFPNPDLASRMPAWSIFPKSTDPLCSLHPAHPGEDASAALGPAGFY